MLVEVRALRAMMIDQETVKTLAQLAKSAQSPAGDYIFLDTDKKIFGISKGGETVIESGQTGNGSFTDYEVVSGGDESQSQPEAERLIQCPPLTQVDIYERLQNIKHYCSGQLELVGDSGFVNGSFSLGLDQLLERQEAPG